MPNRASFVSALAPLLLVACASGASAEPGSGNGAGGGVGGAAGSAAGSAGSAGDAGGAAGASGSAGKGAGGSGASSGSGAGASGGAGTGGSASGSGGTSSAGSSGKGGAAGTSAGGAGASGKGGSAGAAAGAGGTGSSGMGGAAGGGTGGSGGTSSCPVDPNEPNDTVGQSFKLPDSSDCDGDGGSFSGVLAGSNDQDWFALHFTDKSLCTVDRAVTINASMGMLVCIFFKADTGTAKVTCPAGAFEMGFAVPGYDGCCTNDKSLSVTYGSGGSDDSASVLFSVAGLDPTVKCGDYTVSYHF